MAQKLKNKPRPRQKLPVGTFFIAILIANNGVNIWRFNMLPSYLPSPN